MDFIQARRRADSLIWIGTDAVYLWDRQADRRDQLPLPAVGIPGVPNLHALWEEGKPQYHALAKRLGGRLRRRMRHLLVAVPDDATWIEQRALEDFMAMAGAGAVGKRLFLSPQSVLLGPAEERFLAITWSCRCVALCLVNCGAVARRIWLPITQLEGLDRALETLQDGTLPVYYPQLEPAPFPPGLGTGVYPEGW